MRPYISLAVAAASLAAAQDLATALSDRPELSSLVELLGSVPNTTEFLAAQQDVTLFAPNNDALAMIVANGGIFNLEEAGVDAGLIEQILRYHFVRGVVQSTDATPSPQFLPTLLNYSGVVLDGEVSGSNVTGGQVVNVQLVDGAVNVIAGIKSAVQVVVADIPYDNGVVHIIDELLTIPLSISATLIAGNFTALAGAATQAGLVPTLEGLSDVTIFAPNNDAFQAIGGPVGLASTLTLEQLADVLQYHVVQGTVAYSTSLSNTSIETLNGNSVSIHIDGDGAVFVNEARVINTDVLIAGGVLHVLEDVLNPSGRNVPYPGASGVDVPFTSGIAPETSIYDELSGTTSFVAAGPAATPASVSGSPGMSGNATMATQGSASPTSSGPIQQTANAAATDGARVVMAGLLGAAAAVVAL